MKSTVRLWSVLAALLVMIRATGQIVTGTATGFDQWGNDTLYRVPDGHPLWTGTIALTLDGTPTFGYCVTPNVDMYLGTTYQWRVGPAPDRISELFTAHYPPRSALESTALQLAIWQEANPLWAATGNQAAQKLADEWRADITGMGGKALLLTPVGNETQTLVVIPEPQDAVIGFAVMLPLCGLLMFTLRRRDKRRSVEQFMMERR